MKADIKPREREKFAQHVMVSDGVCFCGKGRLHFVDESAISGFCVLRWPSSSQSCRRLHSTVAQWIHLPAKRCASTHSSCHAELHAPNQLLRFHCQRPVASKFTRLEPLGLPCLGAMLEAYHKRHPKQKTIAELKEVLQVGQPTPGTNR